MPEIDRDLAAHCLEGLGGRRCPVMEQRNAARVPSDACDGLSIRDQLFEFCVQAQQEVRKRYGKKKKASFHREFGHAKAFAYSIALIDNPYMPDWEAVLDAAKKEAENR